MLRRMTPDRLTPLDDPQDARLAPYLNLPDRQLQHLTEGLFIAEGELVVRKLIDSTYRVR